MSRRVCVRVFVCDDCGMERAVLGDGLLCRCDVLLCIVLPRMIQEQEDT
jgi:hypothetical protein